MPKSLNASIYFCVLCYLACAAVLSLVIQSLRGGHAVSLGHNYVLGESGVNVRVQIRGQTAKCMLHSRSVT